MSVGDLILAGFWIGIGFTVSSVVISAAFCVVGGAGYVVYAWMTGR